MTEATLIQFCLKVDKCLRFKTVKLDDEIRRDPSNEGFKLGLAGFRSPGVLYPTWCGIEFRLQLVSNSKLYMGFRFMQSRWPWLTLVVKIRMQSPITKSNLRGAQRSTRVSSTDLLSPISTVQSWVADRKGMIECAMLATRGGVPSLEQVRAPGDSSLHMDRLSTALNDDRFGWWIS